MEVPEKKQLQTSIISIVEYTDGHCSVLFDKYEKTDLFAFTPPLGTGRMPLSGTKLFHLWGRNFFSMNLDK